MTAALDSKGVAYEEFDLFAKQTAGRNPMLSMGVPGDDVRVLQEPVLSICNMM